MPSESRTANSVTVRLLYTSGAISSMLQPIVRYMASDNLGYFPKANIL